MELIDRLTAPGPKRVLALDGGGMRGLITLGILERIEAVLRDRHGDPDLRLSDYFDLIGGSSTGAVIAAALAKGLTTADIKEMYAEFGAVMFARHGWRFWRTVRARFDARPLEQQFTRILGENTQLGDTDLRTGLCIIAKRADTGSTWRLFNHPHGKYFEDNRDILLRNAVRASVAGPTFFEPIAFEVKPGKQTGAFVDGGVSMANNPGLELFLVATLKGFPFRWPTGAENLMVVSVGTGSWSNREKVEDVVGGTALKSVKRTISMLMNDTDEHGKTMLQAMSDSPTALEIDREIGDLHDDMISGTPALHYLRYNVSLEAEELESLGLKQYVPKLGYLRDAFSARESTSLAAIGEVTGKAQVKPEHFPVVFDRDRAAVAARIGAAGPGGVDRLEQIRATTDPAILNLLVTQWYHEAAAAMTRFIDSRDVTWFGFGARASKTVGRNIRFEMLPPWARGPMTQTSANRFLRPMAAYFFSFRAAMVKGNILVFEELAPLAREFLTRFGHGAPDAAGIDSFVAALRPGGIADGGQDLLKTAFRAWYDAAHESDLERKSQLVLLGNCSAVYYEQQRLQPILDESFQVPVLDAAVQRAARTRVAGPLLRPARPVGLAARRLWQRVTTNTPAFSAYDLPEMDLAMGADVRGPVPGVDFPPTLQELVEPRLLALFAELNAPLRDTRGSAAGNWASLRERMPFIATLFRSRQQDLGLLAPPFTRLQVEALMSGKMPTGTL